jgi:hypothetical protein
MKILIKKYIILFNEYTGICLNILFLKYKINFVLYDSYFKIYIYVKMK